MHLFLRRIRPVMYVMALSILAFSLWGTGCGSPLVQDDKRPDFCRGNDDCGANKSCLNQTCVVTTTTQQQDAGLPWDAVPNACLDGQTKPCQIDGSGKECSTGTSTCLGRVWGECNPRNQAVEECNGKDDNCDGQIDETFPAANTPCQSTGQGECRVGKMLCKDGKASCAPTSSPKPELCDNKDNDCNGQIDDLPEGPCTLPDKKGPCAQGKQVCRQGISVCEPTARPVPETCNGIDDNCDGKIDEELTRACYSGSADTRGKGSCKDGVQTCSGGAWGGCKGEILPQKEVCNRFDDNCDGRTDEPPFCTCSPGQTQRCAPQAGPGREGVGECKSGEQTCDASGNWGRCMNETPPKDEDCNGKDDDCNGKIDNVDTRCYDGQFNDGKSLKGVCKVGSRVCSSGQWGKCLGDVKPSVEICDGFDNDCNGQTDENLDLKCGADVGECKKGIRTCQNGAYGDCSGQGPVPEVCDGKDNNCDGNIDEDWPDKGKACFVGVGECKKDATWTCTANGKGLVCPAIADSPKVEVCNNKDDDCNGLIDDDLSRACGQDVGECVSGKQACSAGQWGPCIGEVTATPEVCDGKDNNCNGQTDEGLPTCVCVPTTSEKCYTGPPDTQGVGLCATGTRVCDTNGKWGPCIGDVKPQRETCNGKDDNCDGQIDEFLTRQCDANRAECNKLIHPMTGQVTIHCKGVCQPGTETCQGGTWGVCVGAVFPSIEVCDGKDNDCNGQTDEDFPGKGDTCLTGQLGLCASGVKACMAGKVICQQTVQPTKEVCDGKDNNCDGKVDNDVTPACTCINGASESCYTGPQATVGVGICKAGTRVCAGGVWGPCLGEVIPKDEICDGLDNNCNGRPDENVTQECYPINTKGCTLQADGSYKCNGACQAGIQKCIVAAGTGFGWSSCQQAVTPTTEICDNIDNDCDGKVDEVCGTQYNYVAISGSGAVALRGFQNPYAGGATLTVESQLPINDPCNSQIMIVTAQSSEPGGATYECGNKKFTVTTFKGTRGKPKLEKAYLPFHALSPTDGVYGYVECTSTTTCSLKWTNDANAVSFAGAFGKEGIVKLDADFCKDEQTTSGSIVRKPFFATLYGNSPGFIQTWTAGTQDPQGSAWGKCEIQTFRDDGVRELRSFVFWFPPKDKAAWAHGSNNGVVVSEIADFNAEFTSRWQMKSFSQAIQFIGYEAGHVAWMRPSLVITTPLFDDFNNITPYLLPFTIGASANYNIRLYPYRRELQVQGPYFPTQLPFALLYGRTP